MSIPVILVLGGLIILQIILVNIFVIKNKLSISFGLTSSIISIIILCILFLSKFIDNLAFFLGIQYPPALYFFIVIVLILNYLLYLHYQIQNTKKEINRLYQEMSILISKEK